MMVIRCLTHGTYATFPRSWGSHTTLSFHILDEKWLDFSDDSLKDFEHVDADGTEVEDTAKCEFELLPDR